MKYGAFLIRVEIEMSNHWSGIVAAAIFKLF